MKKNIYLIFSILSLQICLAQKSNMENSFQQIPLPQQALPNSKLLTQILESKPELFGKVLAQKDSMHLQIIFTQIDRDAKGQPHFTHHFYNLSNQYFYPASTVKFPTAVLALEKLNNLKISGLNANTTMLTDSGNVSQTSVSADSTAENKLPSLEHYIKKILLVSDNDAFNRLYEFMGQQPLNERLNQLGFSDAQIIHRLSISLLEKQNRITNPIRFVNENVKLIYTQPLAESKLVYQKRNDFLGKGYMAFGSNYYKGDTLINEPMDFSKKNKLPLSYLHQMLQWVMFPQSQPAKNKLNLTASDYSFLHKYMGMFPTESAWPKYDTANYYPAYCKFLFAGSDKINWPNKSVRIFNKVGDAYGFLIDVAYIIDYKTKTELMVSCAMLCNQDGIFNDDKYDYDTIGFPFMKNLGQVLLAHEKNRTKKYVPNFDNLKFKEYNLE